VTQDTFVLQLCFSFSSFAHFNLCQIVAKMQNALFNRRVKKTEGREEVQRRRKEGVPFHIVVLILVHLPVVIAIVVTVTLLLIIVVIVIVVRLVNTVLCFCFVCFFFVGAVLFLFLFCHKKNNSQQFWDTGLPSPLSLSPFPSRPSLYTVKNTDF